MIEKVNPAHPDKLADRIAGAIVDLGYTINANARVAVEVMLGHGACYVMVETSIMKYKALEYGIANIVNRIATGAKPVITIVQQDEALQANQANKLRCGDNGIFKGVPLSLEEKHLARIARQLYSIYPYDGKYILGNGRLVICQSNADTADLTRLFPNAIINPLGNWTGGYSVDTGCTNRKLGSDMAQSVTGGGLHGKDFSKADVSINIYAFLKAQETGKTVELSCAIGDEYINGKPYAEIVEVAKKYIRKVGGFEKFAEWGLF